MNIDEHLYKAAAFERALAKLDPLDDAELYAVFLMRAGTNRLNAALHALEVTRADGPTATHLGDLNHTYKPPMKAPPPAALSGAFAALTYIENLRPDYVRGAAEMDDATASRAHEAYRRIVDETATVLKEHAA